MAPRSPNAYDNPELSFQINVTGTANLLHAAQKLGITNIVLISSESAVSGYPAGSVLTPAHFPRAKDDLYCLTKSLQEILAEHWTRVGGLSITQLRIGYVVDGEKKVDKYGKQVSGGGQTDRFDIARAVLSSIENPAVGLRTYFVVCGHQSEKRYTENNIRKDLHWLPRFPNGV
jgi:nucleoside-diphosphate-sugar epimerase